MKIIPKKQNGGNFLSLFADYTPIPPQQSTSSSGGQSSSKKKDDSDSEKGKLTEKDLFSLLKDIDGLPNEMQQLVTSIQRMYSQVSLFGNDDIDTSSLANMYMQNLYKLKHANFNKKEYDKAYTEAEKNEALNEFAINSSGKMVVYDKDQKLKEISVNEFLNNQGEYQPITNSNLLWLRAHDPSFSNNNQILDVVNNGMGINKVEKLIRDRFSSLGTSEESQSGYVAKAGNQVMQGVKVLNDAQELIQQSGMTMDGLYKNKRITKTQKQQAQAALQYIYQTLPENAKSILKLYSGNSDDPTKGAVQIIENMLTSRMSESSSFDVDYQDNLNLDGSKKSGSGGKDSEINENAPTMFLRGRGERSTVNLIPGENTGFRINATTMYLVGADNKPFEGNYLDELTSSGFGPILDIKNASMGNGLKILVPNQVQIMDKHIRKVLFPANPDGTPDLREGNLESVKQAEAQLLQMGINVNDEESFQRNYQTISEVYANYGLSNGNNLKYFAILDGRANNQALGMDLLDNNNYLEAVSDAEYDEYEKTWAREHSKGNNKQKLDLDHNNGWINPADWFGNYDQVYDGLIWIPIINSYANAQIGTGETIKPSLANREDKQEFISQREEAVRRNYIDPSNLE